MYRELPQQAVNTNMRWMMEKKKQNLSMNTDLFNK